MKTFPFAAFFFFALGAEINSAGQAGLQRKRPERRPHHTRFNPALKPKLNPISMAKRYGCRLVLYPSGGLHPSIPKPAQNIHPLGQALRVDRMFCCRLLPPSHFLSLKRANFPVGTHPTWWNS